MSVAVRSVFTASIAVAAAGVIAVTPLAPAPDVHLPRLESAAVLLADTAVPAFGALPYQVVVNQIGNAIALLPTLIGGTEQCTACQGPVATSENPTASPFTGWGAIGIAVGVLGSPLVLGQTLLSTGNAGQALADAGAAISVPVSNTLSMLQADRIVYGGAQFAAARNRGVNALSDTVTLGVQVAAQAIVYTPLAIASGVAAGAGAFVQTYNATGNLNQALQAGVAPVQTAVTTSIAALTMQVQTLRSTVYADLTSGPSVTTIPTPIVSSTPVAGASVGAQRGSGARTAAAAASAPKRVRAVAAR